MEKNILLLFATILFFNCENNAIVQDVSPHNPPELTELIGYWRTTFKQIDFLNNDGSLDTTRMYSIDGEEYHIFTDSTYSQMGYFEQYSCRIPQVFEVHFSLSDDTLLIPEMDSINSKFEEQNGNTRKDLRLIKINGKTLTENHFVTIISDTAIELNIIYKYEYSKVSFIDSTNWPTKICD